MIHPYGLCQLAPPSVAGVTPLEGLRRRSRTGRWAVVAVGAVLIGGGAMWALRSDAPDSATFADAVTAGDLGLAGRLAASGVDPNGPRVLGMTPLMRAANRDDAAMVEALFAAGADLGASDPEGLTATHVAAQADAAASMVALAELGADLGAASRNGMTAFHHAADTGAVHVLRVLADLGVDVDGRSAAITQGHGYPRDIGATALGIAARANRIDAVRLLVELGADVDRTSATGHTPLQLAVFAGSSPELLAELLAAGADPHREARCDAGCSLSVGDTIEWARRLDRSELVPVLEAATTP